MGQDIHSREDCATFAFVQFDNIKLYLSPVLSENSDSEEISPTSYVSLVSHKELSFPCDLDNTQSP